MVADLIIKQFPNAKAVADIAGGKGDLNRALRKRGVPKVVTFETRKKHKSAGDIEYRREPFGPQVDDEFDLLVGLHPDEATDVIVTEAVRRGIGFVVVPCCILPTTSRFQGDPNPNRWLKHLRRLGVQKGREVISIQLPMGGKNIALVGR